MHTCQQEAEKEERKRAAKARLEESDRRAIEKRAAQSLEPSKILEPPRNPWGNAESVGIADASFAGLGGGAHVITGVARGGGASAGAGLSGDAEGGAELVAAMLCNLSSDILDDLAKSSAWNLSLDESEGGGMGMGKSLGTSLGLDDGDLGIFDADNVATGAAISVLQGDDELTAGLAGLQPGGGIGVGSGTYTDPLLDANCFNTPAGWSLEASREGLGMQSSASWGDSASNHGAAVDIGKSFQAFHGVGSSGVFGGMLGGGDSCASDSASHAAPSKLGGWSGKMGMSDISSDLQFSSRLGAGRQGRQGGWEASLPVPFLPAGDEGGAMATMKRSGKGRRGGKNRQHFSSPAGLFHSLRDSASSRGSGRGVRQGAQAAETAVPAGGKYKTNAVGTNGEAVAVEGGQGGGGYGGGGEKQGGWQNTKGQTGKRGGDKSDYSDKSSTPQAEESGVGASTSSGADFSGGDATACGQAGTLDTCPRGDRRPRGSRGGAGRGVGGRRSQPAFRPTHWFHRT